MTVKQIEDKIARLKKRRDEILHRPGLGGYLTYREGHEVDSLMHQIKHLQRKLQAKTTPQTEGERFEEGDDFPF